MMTRLFGSTVVLFAAFALSASGQPQPEKKTPRPSASSGEKAPAAPTMSVDGIQISLLGVARQKQYSLIEGGPPGLGADPGFDIAVVKLSVIRSEGAKELDYGRFSLEARDGKRYKCPLLGASVCDAAPGLDRACQIPIVVPQGAQLSLLRYGEVSLEVPAQSEAGGPSPGERQQKAGSDKPGAHFTVIGSLLDEQRRPVSGKEVGIAVFDEEKQGTVLFKDLDGSLELWIAEGKTDDKGHFRIKVSRLSESHVSRKYLQGRQARFALIARLSATEVPLITNKDGKVVVFGVDKDDELLDLGEIIVRN